MLKLINTRVQAGISGYIAPATYSFRDDNRYLKHQIILAEKAYKTLQNKLQLAEYSNNLTCC